MRHIKATASGQHVSKSTDGTGISGKFQFEILQVQRTLARPGGGASEARVLRLDIDCQVSDRHVAPNRDKVTLRRARQFVSDGARESQKRKGGTDSQEIVAQLEMVFSFYVNDERATAGKIKNGPLANRFDNCIVENHGTDVGDIEHTPPFADSVHLHGFVRPATNGKFAV